MHYGIFNTPKGCLNILKFIYISYLTLLDLIPINLNNLVGNNAMEIIQLTHLHEHNIEI